VVHTTEDQTVAAGHSLNGDLALWQAGLEDLLGRVAGRFPRVEPRRRARAFVQGLLADLPRKNCWTIAEHAGDPSLGGMQHLLARAAWDHDGVRDDLRAYLVEHLGDPDGVLVVDETGDLKKGIQTVGVQRQYTGTAGRVENAQVAVLLVYAGPAGHGVIDRELYVPRSWTRDPDRLRAAGVPDQVGFATKPALATAMLCRALDAGVPASWVTGDEVYGADPTLRAWLEGRGIGYVLAVACDHPIVAGGATWRADELRQRVPARAWQRVSAGQGAKGHRFYDWAFASGLTAQVGMTSTKVSVALCSMVVVVTGGGCAKAGAPTSTSPRTSRLSSERRSMQSPLNPRCVCAGQGRSSPVGRPPQYASGRSGAVASGCSNVDKGRARPTA
jgi:SRSO17 transposase